MFIKVKLQLNLREHISCDRTEKDFWTAFATFMGVGLISTDVEDFSFNRSTLRPYSHLGSGGTSAALQAVCTQALN